MKTRTKIALHHRTRFRADGRHKAVGRVHARTGALLKFAPRYKNPNLRFSKNEVHLETPVILFIVCAKNKITSENMRNLIALVSTCLTF